MRSLSHSHGIFMSFYAAELGSLSAHWRMPGRGVSSTVFPSLHIRTAYTVSGERCFAPTWNLLNKDRNFQRYSILNPPVGGHGTHYSILPTRYPIRKCIDRPQMPPSAFDTVVAVAFDSTDVAALLALYDAHMVDAPGA